MESSQLINTLKSIRTRVRTLSVIAGLGIVVTAGIGMILATLLLDFLLNLQAGPRFAFIFATLVGIVYAVRRWVILPVSAHLSLGDVAGRLEQAFPQFDDRLRSTVDFLDGPVPGSEAMKNQVMTEAGRLVAATDLHHAILVKPVWYSAGAGLSALLLAMGLMLTVNPQYLKVALSRIISPFNAMAWPKSVQISLGEPLPLVVPVGTRVPVHIRLSKGDRSSRKAIVYSNVGGAEQSEYMTRGSDGIYTASIDARTTGDSGTGTLNLRVSAGDDEMVLPAIRIVPRLSIHSVDAVVTPPAYAKLPSSTINLTQSPAVVVAGSNVELRLGFNKPLDISRQIELDLLKPSSLAGAVRWDMSKPGWAIGQWTAMESTRFHIKATDADGFANLAMEEYELIIRPDQNPIVQIENPSRNEERTPVAVVPLQGMAEDDFGIQSLQLSVKRLGDKKGWTIDLVKNGLATGQTAWAKLDSSDARQRFRANLAWDLARLEDANLKSGDVLEYCLIATDNFELEGKRHDPVSSGKLRLTIISQGEFTQKVTEELRAMAFQIGEIRTMQNRTLTETRNFQADTKDKPKLDPADKAVANRLINQQSTAAVQTKSVAGKLETVIKAMEENKSTATDLKTTAKETSEILNTTAETPMKDATGKLNQANEGKSTKPERNELLDSTQKDQKTATDQLQKAMERMGNIGTLAQMIDTLRDILSAQRGISKESAEIGKRNLGKKPEQMSPEDRDKLNKNAKDQADLANKTEKAIKELDKQAANTSKSNPSDSEAMKKAADTGRQQQVSSNQSKAASSLQQNQQSSAQSSQKQAELGLEMILGDLREAERRKLEELVRKLEELHKQLQGLVRRQAGHNLDDLSLQGPDRLARLESLLLTDLLAKAERNKDRLPAVPTIAQLTSGQEQTERNTRDIGKSIEELSTGAEAAAHLTRAAERMQRAIVFLRDAKLPDAYDPPMTEALSALEEAVKLIDQQKKEADDKQNQQKKDSVRAVYEKVRLAQLKVNKDTADIDLSPRKADGSLKRDEAIRLGQLPGEQGSLADELTKLDEALSALRSVVYTWANADIIKTMNEVKDDLGKQVTGESTQSEQARIIEQLDAMIKDLSIKPKQSDFAQRGSGGGGGAGKPPAGLPSEAELRLLKDLQQAINKATRTIDKQPNKDAPKLLALGTRQGELRGLLDRLIRKASDGEVKLGPEPDNRDQLPEEADANKIEDQELEKDLLTDKPAADKTEKAVMLVGDRMARSRQRLALNSDPGKVTQVIQERILKDLDQLIDQARQQQAQTTGKPKPGNEGQQAGPPKPGGSKPGNQGQANSGVKNEGGQNPADNSKNAGNPAVAADLSKDIQEKMSEWGGLTPRQRSAVIEGAGETVVEKYRKLIDDYYRTLATRATEK